MKDRVLRRCEIDAEDSAGCKEAQGNVVRYVD